MSEEGEKLEKLLIAEHDSALRDDLVGLLRRKYDITTCADGQTALELITTIRPNVLILDLTMPHLEGIYILEQIQDIWPHIVLCITDFSSDYVVQTIQDLGVDYIFRKPCLPRAIVARLEHIARHVPSPMPMDLQSRTAQILLNLHLAPKSDGFLYLKIGIPLYHQDPSQLICKDIYGAIVQIYGLSGWKAVERSIRISIHNAWKEAPSIWEPYFPGLTEPPTNKAFICRISELLNSK